MVGGERMKKGEGGWKGRRMGGQTKWGCGAAGLWGYVAVGRTQAFTLRDMGTTARY